MCLGAFGSSVFRPANSVWASSSVCWLRDYSGSAQYCLWFARVLHWCSFAGMEDATIEAIFDQAAALNADGKKQISAPGAAGLLVLLDSSSLSSTLNDIEGVYDQRGWPANHSPSLEDINTYLTSVATVVCANKYLCKGPVGGRYLCARTPDQQSCSHRLY